MEGKRGKIFYDILLVLGITLLIGAVIYFYFFYKDYSDAMQEYAQISDEYTVTAKDRPEENEDEPEYTFVSEDDSESAVYDTKETDETEVVQGSAPVHHIDYFKGDISRKRLLPVVVTPWYELISVNVAGLKRRNADVRGWIFFENDDISYPILQGTDNEHYLNVTISGAASKAGSIFMDYDNAPDLSDMRTVIYGHNMRNTSMFGKLKYYKYPGYYEDNRYFQIITESHLYRYEIFSCFDIADTQVDMVKTDYEANEDYRLFIDHLKNKSSIRDNLYTSENTKTVSLVTCSNTGRRLMVTGALVESVNR